MKRTSIAQERSLGMAQVEGLELHDAPPKPKICVCTDFNEFIYLGLTFHKSNNKSLMHYNTQTQKSKEKGRS